MTSKERLWRPKSMKTHLAKCEMFLRQCSEWFMNYTNLDSVHTTVRNTKKLCLKFPIC